MNSSAKGSLTNLTHQDVHSQSKVSHYYSKSVSNIGQLLTLPFNATAALLWRPCSIQAASQYQSVQPVLSSLSAASAYHRSSGWKILLGFFIIQWEISSDRWWHSCMTILFIYSSVKLCPMYMYTCMYLYVYVVYMYVYIFKTVNNSQTVQYS